MDVSSFDFDLPDELVAQVPAAARGTSRLLVLQRDTGTIQHALFSALGEHLKAGDLLVLNDTRVFPARLLGRRIPSGGRVECLLIRKTPAVNRQLPGSSSRVPFTGVRHPEPCTFGETGTSGVGRVGVGSCETWEALMHPGQKLAVGARVLFEASGVRIQGEVTGRHFHGRRTVRLCTEGMDLDAAIDAIGHVPLPPYIKRPDEPSDRLRYQTVYARERGSVAAPTAGLHFTTALLDQLAARGVGRADVTLHVGYGTFKPIRADRVEDHEVDPETFSVSADAAAALTRARAEGRRVIAVGTTTVRVLESLAADRDGRIGPQAGETRLFIRPGHRFRVVNGLITNFHLPRSSLLVLVAAFAGRERILAAYQDAIALGYRFYSYGDAMVIL